MIMDTNKNIKNKVEEVLNSASLIQSTNVSPFFKDKTLGFLFRKDEVVHTKKFWFSPKLQLATLVCVVILNVFALTRIKETTYNNNVNQFAESFGLSTSTETFILN
ncbi:MAG: hypothetical protein ACJARX_000190 [Psychroserpens sp.]|jgi:hypothetical protein